MEIELPSFPFNLFIVDWEGLFLEYTKSLSTLHFLGRTSTQVVQVLPEAIQSKLSCPRTNVMCRDGGSNPGPSDPEGCFQELLLFTSATIKVA